LASKVSNLIDERKVMAFGLLVLGGALYSMSDWTPDVSQSRMMMTLLLQGFGIGFVFNPMTVMAFTTLPVALRGYATSLQALCRNIGQAVGVSVTSLLLVRGAQTSHADIAAGITPFDRVLQTGDAASRMLNPATRHGAAMLDRLVSEQAQIIAYNSDFRIMSLVVVPPLLLLLVMRRHQRPAAAPVPTTAAAAAPAAGD
jgi:DHA2 family multidrug resistance protein